MIAFDYRVVPRQEFGNSDVNRSGRDGLRRLRTPFGLRSRRLPRRASARRLKIRPRGNPSSVRERRLSLAATRSGLPSTITRTHSKSVVFSYPFELKGMDRIQLKGMDRRVVTDEELIDGLSFSVYRRVSIMIFVPAQSHH